MAFKSTASGVSFTRGRGAAKVAIEISFKSLEDWAKRMKIDEPKLMQRSFGRACSGLKKKFQKVVSNAGGVEGVPKFKDFEAFTQTLREKRGGGWPKRPMGGVLSNKRQIVAFRRNGWQVIGWPDRLAKWAVTFQDAIVGYGEKQLNDRQWRRAIHKIGVREIPRTYVRNPRRVIPEPFGTYVRSHLREWARAAYYKELARLMQKAGALK